MKTAHFFLRLVSLFQPILVCLSLSANTVAAENDGLDRIAAQFEQQRTIKGTFEQSRSLAGMPRPIVSRGEFIYWKQHGLYWETSHPFFNASTFTPAGIAHWQSRGVKAQSAMENPRVEQEVSRILLSIFSADREAIKQRFTVAASGDKKGWSLTLTPSNPIVRRVIERITVTGGELIEQVNIAAANGDHTDIRLSEARINAAISAEECGFFVAGDEADLCGRSDNAAAASSNSQ